MARNPHQDLSRRERQIMDLLYEHGKLTAAEVHEKLPEPPSYSAVRAMLRILEEKGHIRHEEVGLRYVFFPVVARERARTSAVRHLIQTFFSGSTEQAVAALIDESAGEISDEELNRIAGLIEKAKREGR
jgi:predicted transcriptional regulator